MMNFIKEMQRAANKFSVLDFALFKIYLVAVGVLLGGYFATFWLEWITLVWIVAVVCGAITVARLFYHYISK